MNLSIIIVSYNTKELLERCLESIMGDRCLGLGDSKGKKRNTITQPLSPNTEIIVVDNGSTDGSVGVINELTKLRINGLKIKTILNKENLGFAKAVNQGILQSQGEAILLLNSDTTVKEDALSELLTFENKVRPAITGARMLNPDGTVQGSCFYLPTVGRAIKEYWFGKSGYFSKYAPIGDKPVEVEAVSGGAMLISKGVIDKIGLLDERYFFYFEDLDYCRRAKKSGFKVYYLPTAKIIHEHGASGRNLAKPEKQWKRLIPSSMIYHGPLRHFLINLIIRLGQLWEKRFGV